MVIETTDEIKKPVNLTTIYSGEIIRRPGNVVDFMMMKESEVIHKFASLPGAQTFGIGMEQFTYIPGLRKNKVLLVSHTDTVWHDKDVKVGYRDGRFFSLRKDVGIGADDRAGCAILWQLRNSGHSLLLPSGEESGCRGSRFLQKQGDWFKKINEEHQFAIEFDRRGDDDLVFYGVGSKAFGKWCEENFKGFTTAQGSFTDIGVLCDPICGLNISVGYYQEHSSNEHLIQAQWINTLKITKKVLEQAELNRFEQDPKPVYTPSYGSRRHNFNNVTDDRFTKHWDDNYTHESLKGGLEQSYNGRTDDILVCPYCDGTMDDAEWQANGNKCVFAPCNKGF